MKEFDPPLEKRTTDELIAIATGIEDYWQKEAVKQAKVELKTRGVSSNEQYSRIQEWNQENEEFQKIYIEWLDRNKNKRYSIFQTLVILFGSPFILIRKLPAWESLTELWRLNYKFKFFQRLTLLIVGIMFWAFVMSISFEQDQKEWLEEIENSDISEWEKNRITPEERDKNENGL